MLRLVAKGTVEELMLRRAYRKLALKQRVLDQGLFAMSNEEILADAAPNLQIMLQFGLSKILSNEASTIGAEDADRLLKSAAEVQRFVAEADEDEENLYEFEGTDFQRGKIVEKDRVAFRELQSQVGSPSSVCFLYPLLLSKCCDQL